MDGEVIGVIGGSGLYRLLDDVTSRSTTTPYGEPSGPLVTAVLPSPQGDRRVCFIPRHGPRHTIPPHRINSRANLWALREAGVTRVLAPCACGSLRPDRHPGDVVVCDQLVDRTAGRPGTFFDGPVVYHAPMADPYCPQLGGAMADAAQHVGMPVHRGGTVVVIDGPRFATRAESATYRRLGYDLVNMTQAPEAALARELGMCYAALALVTDYDSGVEDRPDVPAVTQEAVLATFDEHVDRLRAVLLTAVGTVGARACGCPDVAPPVPVAGDA